MLMYFMNSKRDKRGLAVLDVVLGMTIFALLVVIGLQNLATIRERARMTGVMSDARTVADKIYLGGEDRPAEAKMIESSDGPIVLASSVSTAGAPVKLSDVTDPVDAFGLILTKGNRLVLWATNTPHFGYCIEYAPNGGVADGPWAAYRSDLGGVYATGYNGGCTTLTPDEANRWTLPEQGQGPTTGPTAYPDGTEPIVEDDPDEGETDDNPVDPDSNVPAPEPTPDVPLPSPPPPTSEATPEPTPDPEPGVLWERPTSNAEIEALCARAWPGMIYGNGAVVYGTEGPDIIFAGNGGQTVYGLGGDDLICGGNGKDTLYGGEGNDVLFGGNGKDVLFGGPGADILHGDNGKDQFDDDELDIVFGGNGKDTYLPGGEGDEWHPGNGR